MSSNFKATPEKGFPATDLRDFIDSVLEANTSGKKFLAHLTQARFMSGADVTLQQNALQHDLAVLKGLLAIRREYNAHYGWVLASDAALVYRSMGGKSENGAIWARHWTRSIFDEYERTSRALIDAKQELEVMARRAGSGCEM